ncbi:fluoride efflux transporter FluC [Aeromicrobium sp. CTD01-1L150]|uniref:fluoride efflux transporter FluC n=1 Tax=Aeromicrobium sp. CTD01-1L150 TaxID=3341830 RepID=UPI0035BF0D43
MPHVPLRAVALVGVGGALGTLARHGVVTGLGEDGGLPSGTLLVNLLGSLLIGVVVAAVASNAWRQSLATGFLGGFTTYSALAVQTRELLVTDPPIAVGYVLATLAGGWFLALLGLAIGRRWVR